MTMLGKRPGSYASVSRQAKRLKKSMRRSLALMPVSGRRKSMMSRGKGKLGPNTTYRYSRYATDPLDIDINSTSQAYGTEYALQNVKACRLIC